MRGLAIGGLGGMLLVAGVVVAVSFRPLQDCQRQQSRELEGFAAAVRPILPDADIRRSLGCRVDADPQLTSHLPSGVSVADVRSRFVAAGWSTEPSQGDALFSPDGTMSAWFAQTSRDAKVEVDVQNADYRTGSD